MSWNPLVKIYFRQTRANLLRILMLILGIALGVAGVIAIDIAKTSVAKSFDLSTAALTSRSTHQIVGSNFTIPQSLFTRLRTDLGIQQSAPIISAHLMVKEFNQTPLTLLGIDPFSEMHFRDLAVRFQDKGSDLSSLLTHGTGVLVSAATALEYGLEQNDPLTLVFGERQVQTHIAGVLDTRDSSTNTVFQGLILADISLAQEILGWTDHISRIDLILTDPAMAHQVREILPQGVVLVETSRQNQVVRELSRSFEASLTAFSMLALFMGIFLIYNTVSFSITRRRSLNGTLRALGATRGEIFKTVMAEVMIYALVGSGLGILLGILMGKGAVLAVCSTVSDMYFTLTVSRMHLTPATLLKGLAAGIISSFMASVLPATTAAQTLPINLMQRSAGETALKKYLPWITLAGILILGLSIMILFFFTHAPGLDFVSVFLMFAGSALVAPWVILVLIRGFGVLVSPFGGVMARMALGNIRRSLSQTSVLIASLMVVTSVYIGIDIMTSSFRFSIIDWVDGNIGGDIHVSSVDTLNRALPPDLLVKIQAMPQVAGVSAYNIHPIFSRTTGEVHIFSYITDLSNKKWSWTAVEEVRLPPLLDQGWIFVSEIFAHANQIESQNGAQVVLETLKGPVTFQIAGIFRDFFMGGGRIIVGRKTMQEFWGHEDVTALQVFLHNSKDAGPVMEKIRLYVPGQAMVKVVSGVEIKRNILKVFDKTFLITSALQMLTAIVALTGILNSVMALVLERTRELGILRACGAETGQVGRMLLAECTLSGLIAGIMALPLGGAVAWVLIYGVNRQSFGWTYDLILSPRIFFQAVALAGVAALLAGIFPAVKAGRTNIPKALRME